LERLDAALRRIRGLDPRPYAVATDLPDADGRLAYDGPPLTAEEEANVRQYIDFVRSRREASKPDGPDRTTRAAL
jgi:hypothetical protein